MAASPIFTNYYLALVALPKIEMKSIASAYLRTVETSEALAVEDENKWQLVNDEQQNGRRGIQQDA